MGKIIRYNLNDRKKQKIVFTQEGLERFKKEKEELEAKRPIAVNNLQKARELGDLSENGAYKAARFELNHIDSRLRYLTRLIQNAKVVNKPTSDFVQVGSIVIVTDGKKEKTYTIVGDYESNPLEGKISINSPIGRMLLGKKVGNSVTILVPAGSISYTIVKLRNYPSSVVY